VWNIKTYKIIIEYLNNLKTDFSTASASDFIVISQESRFKGAEGLPPERGMVPDGKDGRPGRVRAFKPKVRTGCRTCR